MAGTCKKFLNVFNAVLVTLIGVALIARTCFVYSVLATGFALLTNLRNQLTNILAVNYYATAIFIAAIILVVLLAFGGICGVAGKTPT